jgi:hypothetical protein
MSVIRMKIKPCDVSIKAIPAKKLSKKSSRELTIFPSYPGHLYHIPFSIAINSPILPPQLNARKRGIPEKENA